MEINIYDKVVNEWKPNGGLEFAVRRPTARFPRRVYVFSSNKWDIWVWVGKLLVGRFDARKHPVVNISAMTPNNKFFPN